MKSITLIFLSVIFITKAADFSEKCYNCEETDKICSDPVDVASLPSTECSLRDFNLPRERGFSDHTSKDNLDQSIHRIWKDDVSRAAKNYTFECIKISVTSNNVTGTYRSCVPIPLDIKSNCDYLKEELPDHYKVEHCSVCRGNDCNSAGVLMPITILYAIILGILFWRT